MNKKRVFLDTETASKLLQLVAYIVLCKSVVCMLVRLVVVKTTFSISLEKYSNKLSGLIQFSTKMLSYVQIFMSTHDDSLLLIRKQTTFIHTPTTVMMILY